MATGVNSRIQRITQRRPLLQRIHFTPSARRSSVEGYNGQQGPATVARLLAANR